ncbi:MAG: phospho-N-acetylmuramoyl-pentapeptide-transferase [Clostridia bacterium]|nr:phospho-N-acetylmuramoyl-pentapeptide-transferase [Clostridia bacterium]MBQ9598355.1 phospho-N-acetylmuramoyl-pentapeptide-transferase [Clostridia bacterium]
MNLIISAVTGLIISAVLGYVMVPLLHRLKFGQSIREEGPKWHQKKSGTPTMGGIIFILSTLAATFAITRSFDALLIVGCALLFGLIGFTDDYIKVVKKRNLGLTAKQKFLAQLFIAAAFALLLMYKGLNADVLLPFKNKSVSFGIWYMPFAVFVIVGTVNSVNLTDGLDGLASFITLAVSAFFVIIAKKAGFEGAAVACAALCGGLIGFLIYNVYPAKVFMGDTGSLFLGGFISAFAVRYGFELILIICGGVFVMETLSVIIQVTSFKLTGKRIFKMSPLHHHFEMCGFKETKIVALFTLVTVILCAVAYMGM